MGSESTGPRAARVGMSAVFQMGFQPRSGQVQRPFVSEGGGAFQIATEGGPGCDSQYHISFNAFHWDGMPIVHVDISA